MFYILIVYENGSTQLVTGDTLGYIEDLAIAARFAERVTFFQYGGWPFGPVLNIELVPQEKGQER